MWNIYRQLMKCIKKECLLSMKMKSTHQIFSHPFHYPASIHSPKSSNRSAFWWIAAGIEWISIFLYSFVKINVCSKRERSLLKWMRSQLYVLILRLPVYERKIADENLLIFVSSEIDWGIHRSEIDIEQLSTLSKALTQISIVKQLLVASESIKEDK